MQVHSTHSLVSFRLLWKSSSGRTWSLFLFRRLKGKEKEHEEMSKDMTLDQRGTHRLPQSIHQRALQASRSFITGSSARGRHILFLAKCGVQVGDKRQREVQSGNTTCLLSLPCPEPQRDDTQWRQPHSSPGTTDRLLNSCHQLLTLSSYCQLMGWACEMGPLKINKMPEEYSRF